MLYSERRVKKVEKGMRMDDRGCTLADGQLRTMSDHYCVCFCVLGSSSEQSNLLIEIELLINGL
jgi:hypothetical protein